MKKKRFQKFLILMFLLTISVLNVPLTVKAETEKFDFDAWWNSDDSGFVERWDGSTDPWEILRDSKVITLGGDDFSVSIVNVLRHSIMIILLIGAAISLSMIPFISNSKALEERKQELTYKALIFAACFAVIPILNFAKALLDSCFGF